MYDFPMPPLVKELVYDPFLSVESMLTGPDSQTRDISISQKLFKKIGVDFSKWKRVVVTGSKGKGSTATLLASLLELEGKRVGLVTSPHLRKFNERIRVNGKCISNEDLEKIATVIEPHVRSVTSSLEKPQYLGPGGVILALAWYYFRQQSVDVVVVEAGRGGEYDEAQLLEPDVTVLTPIFEEHTEKLGPLLQIAETKTRVARPHSTIISSDQSKEVAGVIKKTAEELSCSAEFVLNTVAVVPKAARYAPYLLTNLSLSKRAAEVLYPELVVDNELLVEATDRIHWLGKGQVLQENPLIVLDGATNETSIQEILKSFSSAKIVRAPLSRDEVSKLPNETILLLGNQKFIAEVLKKWSIDTGDAW